jgi:hypothetical protein
LRARLLPGGYPYMGMAFDSPDFRLRFSWLGARVVQSSTI